MTNEEAKAAFEMNGYWWCDKCEAEKSAVQVTYDHRCTICREPVVWCGYCHACSEAGGAERDIFHAEPPCTNEPANQPVE